jgi:osmotically-inducible protein OsmY
MKFIIGILLGAALGAGALWMTFELRKEGRKQELSQQLSSAATSARDVVQEQLRILDLRTEDIKDELAKGGTVVRRTARQAGQVISDATLDARTTATIKAKLLGSRELSAWSISVNCTGGVVTLSGSVGTPDQIGKAMLLAMDTEGVREVVSTLQIKGRPASVPMPAPTTMTNKPK